MWDFILISIISICLCLIILYIAMQTHAQEDEPFTNDMLPRNSNYAHKSILVPIPLKHMPIYIQIGETVFDTQYDYTITKAFREAYDRQPTRAELLRFRRMFLSGELDNDLLYMILFNSTEHTQHKDLQNRDVEIGLEHAIWLKRLYLLIRELYKRYVTKGDKSDGVQWGPLKDILIHLRFNLYMFVAVLTDDNFGAMQNAIEEAQRKKLDDNILHDIFYTYMDPMVLQRSANAMKKRDMARGGSSILNSSLADIEKMLSAERRALLEERLQEAEYKNAEAGDAEADVARSGTGGYGDNELVMIDPRALLIDVHKLQQIDDGGNNDMQNVTAIWKVQGADLQSVSADEFGKISFVPKVPKEPKEPKVPKEPNVRAPNVKTE